MARPAENAATISVNTRSDLRKWLQANYQQTEGVWLIKYKKPHKYYLPYDDIVEECICFGWIDTTFLSTCIRRSPEGMLCEHSPRTSRRGIRIKPDVATTYLP